MNKNPALPRAAARLVDAANWYPVRAASTANEAAGERRKTLTRPDHFQLRTSDRMDIMPAVPTSVYLYYDGSDILIYVGITSRGAQRQAEHNHDKDWWQYVVRQEVEHFDSRTKALARERSLILAHTPPFNKQQNTAYETVNAAYMMFRASRSDEVDLRSALKLMQQRIDLDVHYQLGGDPVVLRTRIGDSALTACMRMPDGEAPRVFGLNKQGGSKGSVVRMTMAGPLALIRLSSTTGHPIEAAYASVKFDVNQRLVLRNVHVTLDHSDPRKCSKRCLKSGHHKPKRPEICWVRPDGEGRS